MVSLVWGTHALPLYWEVLEPVGNSDLKTQKRLLKAVTLALDSTGNDGDMGWNYGQIGR